MYEMEKHYLETGMLPNAFIRKYWRDIVRDLPRRAYRIYEKFANWQRDIDNEELFRKFILALCALKRPYFQHVEKIQKIVSGKMNFDEAMDILAQNTPVFWFKMTPEDTKTFHRG